MAILLRWRLVNCLRRRGVQRYSSGQTLTRYKYTGQRAEAGFGLYYYGARWYDPALGRFIQPDTIVPNPGDAKSFDRYAYSFNNPLKYSDPTGHEPIHHSNYPCSYTACVKDKMTGNQIPVSNWTPELHAMYYGDEAVAGSLPDITPDAYSLYIPGPSGSGPLNPVGGVEFLRNNHTGVITLFGVTGAEVAGGTSTTVAMFNAVYNLGEDNMDYRGPFISVSGGIAQIGGISGGAAYSPTRGKGWYRYLVPDSAGAWSVGVGPAVGVGPNGSAGHVEYIPLLSVSPDGTGQYHAGWSLFEDQQHGFINEALEFGMNAFFQKYGVDPYQIDWQDPGR